MKKILLLFILTIAFVSACSSQIKDVPVTHEGGNAVTNDRGDAAMEDKEMGMEGKSTMAIDSTIAVIDKYKYINGAKEAFNSASVYFTQKAGKGFSVATESDQPVTLTVMSGKDCLARDSGEEFDIIGTKEGTTTKLESDKVMNENRDVCITVKTTHQKEIAVHIIVNELSFG